MAPSNARQPKTDRSSPSDTSMTDGINDEPNGGEIRTREEVNNDVTIYPIPPLPHFGSDLDRLGNSLSWGRLLN